MAAIYVLALAMLSVQAKGDVNVYGQPMVDCGPSHATGCEYAAADAGAHQVCVKALPHGFSSETGQGPWSDEFQGKPWCICIWAYSNYILQNKDLPLQCTSIPSNVLEEQYSLDKFQQCGSMSSTEGCGAEDIRRSIQSLCTQCDGQAIDEVSKATLKTSCDKILASAPKADMARLYSDAPPAEIVSSLQTDAPRMKSFAFGIFGMVMASASVGLLVRAFSDRSQNAQQTDAEAGAE